MRGLYMTARIMPRHTTHKLLTSSRSRGITACLLLLAATAVLPSFVSGVKDKANAHSPSTPELIELFRLGDEENGDGVLFYGGIGELVAVDRTGRIFISEWQDPMIYVFAPTGDLVTTIGQKGRGPGEFQWLESLYAGPGDTLYVFDSMLGRLSAFEPRSLGLAYDFTVSWDGHKEPSWLIGVLDTGFLFAYEIPISPGESPEGRRSHVMQVDWTEQVLPPPLHVLPASDWLVSAEGETRFARPTPFGRYPVFRLGPDDNLYSGWTESVDIAVTAPGGMQTGHITHTLPPVPLTRKEIERNLELNGWTGEFRNWILDQDLPATRPAYGTFVVDDDARLWLKVTTPSIEDTTAEWLVLDAESRLLGQIHLPVTTNLCVIRGDRAYAVDQGDVTTLVVYQVQE